MSVNVTRQYTEVLNSGDGDLRVTRQYAEVLHEGDGDLRVTRQYVEVLLENINVYNESLSDTLTITDYVRGPINVSTNDSLTFTEKASRVFLANASDTLEFLFGDGEIDPILIIGDFIPLVESLSFNETVYVETSNWRYTSDNLTITDSVEVHGPIYSSTTTTLHISDHLATPFSVTILDEFILTEILGRNIDLDTNDSLVLTEDLTRFRYTASTTFQIVDYATAAKFGGAIITEFDINESVVLSSTFVRSVVTNTGLGHSLTYFIVSPCTDKEYGPFIGESTVTSDLIIPASTVPFIQTTSSTSRFILSYPSIGATDTVILRAPNFGNLDRFSADRVNREIRGGSIVVFSDPNWPKQQTVSVTFSGLTGLEIEDLQTFIYNHLGEEVHVMDWEGREWIAVIITPNEPATHDGKNNWNIGFEFTGLILDGHQPGESASFQDIVTCILESNRTLADSYQIVESVTFLHIPA
jgi:hypothetical protein